ncbi:MAG: CIA30 family protein [Longimicrobiales bacterium]|nr:CIA30 family protein [Longimicrobiales bacterium]
MRRSVIGLWVSLFPLAALAQEQEMKSIVDFTQPDAVRWNIVNDGVMGGLSSSDLELTDSDTGLFSGFVSLDNNGGFASIRATFQSMDLSGYEGVTIRVRGDGRNYQLRFRMDGGFDGVAYMAEFETKRGEWMEIDLPFEGFRPTFRGRVPRGSGPLDPARIRQMGFLIGDKKDGPFKLEIAWMKTMVQSP